METKKATYRIRNWKEHNRAHKQHGSVSIWIYDEAIENWTTDELTGERGASPTYTDLAIETMAMIQAVYGLPGRQTQSFLQSLFALMNLELTAPDHSTLSRRRKDLTVGLPVKKTSEPHHLVIDSTGVKVYSEGEWKVRQHGWSKRRTWLKLHVCVDESSFEIISACATTNNVSDGEALPDLIKDVSGPISQVSADGAYDQRTCYDAINGRAARAAIPRGKMRRSGDEQLRSPSAISETKTFAKFARLVEKCGSGIAVTIGGLWPKQRCFVSKRSSATV